MSRYTKQKRNHAGVISLWDTQTMSWVLLAHVADAPDISKLPDVSLSETASGTATDSTSSSSSISDSGFSSSSYDSGSSFSGSDFGGSGFGGM